MHAKPPPLPLIATFEVAARHQSFKKAGAELHVTASAVSQQIKKLEQWLECSLFHRRTRQLELTQEDEAFFTVAQQTLNFYRQAHAVFLHRFERPVLRISMVPFVAFEICLPALSAFQQDYPDLQLRIETSMSLVDFASEPVDAAIRLGDGRWPDLETLPLAPAKAALIASPAYIAANPVHDLSDLSQHRLIQTGSSLDDWNVMQRILGLGKIDSCDILVLDDFMAAMGAAEQGLGIAIGVFPLIQPWLGSGRLLAVSPQINLRWQHYFVLPQDSAKRASLMHFYHWLKKQFEQL